MFRTHVLYLVRDPRAMLSSRLKSPWCLTSKDCINTTVLDADLRSDHAEAKKLGKKYSRRFMAVRYKITILMYKIETVFKGMKTS